MSPGVSRGALRGVLLAAAVLLLLAGLTAPAAAHPDVTVATGPHQVPAGGNVTFPMDVHYHRLVGHARVMDPAGAEVSVLVTGPGGEMAAAGPGGDLVLNALIPCCKGDSWTGHAIVIANDGAAAVDVDLRLVLLHDGVAVTGENAESGAILTTVLIFGGVSAFLARDLRQPVARVSGRARRPRSWALRAAGLHAAMWLVSGALAAWGVLRYGGGPVAGTLAATADLPRAGGIIITTHVLVQLLLMALWAASVGAWVAAARRATGVDRRPVGILGVLMGAGSLAACLVWAVEYGHVLAPALVGLTSAAVPLLGGVWMLRGGRGVGWRAGHRAPPMGGR